MKYKILKLLYIDIKILYMCKKHKGIFILLKNYILNRLLGVMLWYIALKIFVVT